MVGAGAEAEVEVEHHPHPRPRCAHCHRSTMPGPSQAALTYLQRPQQGIVVAALSQKGALIPKLLGSNQ